MVGVGVVSNLGRQKREIGKSRRRKENEGGKRGKERKRPQ